jgi:hypothetical protein
MNTQPEQTLLLEVPSENGSAQPDGAPQSAPTRPLKIRHIADYAVACNQVTCRLRHARGRVFQIGGRRRLLFACAEFQRLQSLTPDRPAEAERMHEHFRALAELSVMIADGVFRHEGALTAARLLFILMAKLDRSVREKPRHELELLLKEAIAHYYARSVANLLEAEFEPSERDYAVEPLEPAAANSVDFSPNVEPWRPPTFSDKALAGA